MKIQIYDSTLRDGAQGEGISFSLQDRINIAKALDKFGVDYIEAGTPASNPKDMSFFLEMKKIPLKNAKLVAFGSTKRPDVPIELDSSINSLLQAETQTVAIFGKAWDLHVEEILHISRQENLTIIRESLTYLKKSNKEVIFDAEHFFDGYLSDPEYALSVIQTASEAGTDIICLCDTNGGTLPHILESITRTVCQTFPHVKLGIHCHNDAGCAVANSLAAIQAGVIQVQGTFTGFGERCGNTDLSTILPNLILKCGHTCMGDLKELQTTATYISEVSNMRLHPNMPYVGKSAFAHKAGMHIDAVMKLPHSFEHIDPTLVGNHRKFITSEYAGRSSILPKILKFFPDLSKNSPETEKIIHLLKEYELFGYQYEAAQASFELMIKKALGLWQPHFEIAFFKTTDDFPNDDGGMHASAIVQVNVKDKTEIAGAVGNGPVNALDLALRKALITFFPQLSDLKLSDFKVRVIDDGNSSAAKTRVLIESLYKGKTVNTIGVSNDIIEASFMALVDSVEFILSQ